MSMKLVSLVWPLDLDKTTTVVLMALCDSADDDGNRCYPSMDYVCWKARVSRATGYRVIDSLEAAHIIMRSEHPNGRTEWVIHIENAKQRRPFERPSMGRPKKSMSHHEKSMSHHETDLSHHETNPCVGSAGSNGSEGVKTAPIRTYGSNLSDPSLKYPLARSAPSAGKSAANAPQKRVTNSTEQQSRAEPRDASAPSWYPLWRSFAESLPTPTTRAGARSWSLACADLERAHATPNSIQQAIAAYCRLWPAAACTPMAVAKHYDRLALGQSHEQWKMENDRRRVDTERRRRESDAEARRADRARAFAHMAHELGIG